MSLIINLGHIPDYYPRSCPWLLPRSCPWVLPRTYLELWPRTYPGVLPRTYPVHPNFINICAPFQTITWSGKNLCLYDKYTVNFLWPRLTQVLHVQLHQVHTAHEPCPYPLHVFVYTKLMSVSVVHNNFICFADMAATLASSNVAEAAERLNFWSWRRKSSPNAAVFLATWAGQSAWWSGRSGRRPSGNPIVANQVLSESL